MLSTVYNLTPRLTVRGEVWLMNLGDQSLLVSVFALVIATSGIDYNIKLWEPLAEEPCALDDLEEVRNKSSYLTVM